MSDKLSRRDFVKAGTAASVVATVPAAAFGQAPTVLVRRATPPLVISSANGHEYAERRPPYLRGGGLPADRQGRGRARLPGRGSRHRRARPRRDVRRLRRPAQRGRRRAARLLLHARPAEARGRGGLPRGRAHPGAGREGRPRPHRPPPAGRGGGAGVRPPDGLPGRGRSQHRQVAGPVARVEAPRGPGALPRPGEAVGRLGGREPRDGGGRAPSPEPPLGHDQLRRGGPEGRGLRRHHHERPRVQDPRAGGRLADPRRGPVGGRRGGGGGSTGRGEANLYNLSSFFIVEEMRRGRSPGTRPWRPSSA